MWTDLSAIAACLDEVRAILDAIGIVYKIDVFSVGIIENFDDLNLSPDCFYIDHDVLQTMQQLIETDVLIMAKSAFSYVAAIISDGVKIAEGGSYPPMPGWIVRDGAGRFDRQTGQRRLRQQHEKQNSRQAELGGSSN